MVDCSQPNQLGYDDRVDILHLIIMIKSEVSTFAIVVMFFRGWVS